MGDYFIAVVVTYYRTKLLKSTITKRDCIQHETNDHPTGNEFHVFWHQVGTHC